MNVVGPKIRQLRQEKDWTQEALAARCNILDWDISRGTLAKIESQLRRVTDQEVVVFAKALRVDIEQIYRQPKPARQTVKKPRRWGFFNCWLRLSGLELLSKLVSHIQQGSLSGLPIDTGVSNRDTILHFVGIAGEFLIAPFKVALNHHTNNRAVAF